MRLEGRAALVAGGAGSMGSAVAQLFAAAGAAVCVADMDKERADEVVGEIVEDGGRAIAAAFTKRSITLAIPLRVNARGVR